MNRRTITACLALHAVGCSHREAPSPPPTSDAAVSQPAADGGAGARARAPTQHTDNADAGSSSAAQPSPEAGKAGSSTAGASGKTGAGVAGAGAGGGGAGSGVVAGDGAQGPLAFPGALGFGKNATGGRNGTVYHVTNLNDSGTGSIRDAVSVSNRFIVFDVGGYISIATAISAKSDLTIAGQTAPGGGIGLRGGELSFANSSNIIMRHMRIRPGSDTASTEDDALSLYRAQNVMIDHTSLAFAPWNNIDGVSDDWEKHPVTDISIQDSLIADPTGQQFGAHTESVSSQWAWYRNIFANSHNRNPLAKTNTVFVNNLLYNVSAGYTTHTSTNFQHDILNNYFVFGPASTGTDNTWYQIDKNQSIYAAGNVKDTNLNGQLDGSASMPSWYQGPGTILANPWSNETTATPALDSASAARVAISCAGALPRDALDALIISQVMTLGKGTTGLGEGSVGPDGKLYTSQAQTGLANDGYGTIASGMGPADSDNDGMSDAWESATGSNLKLDDAMTKAADGYARIEHYANWLAGPHAVSNGGESVAVDLSAYTTGFSAVSPSFKVMDAQNGSVTLDAAKLTAHFQPDAGFRGLASFNFSVSGSDASVYSARVVILAAP
jgi:pectate lyase